jgi:hypothetical protein
MSLSVDAELQKLLEQVRRECGEKTASKAIRWALRKAIAKPPSVTLGMKIINWAKSLKFMSKKEEYELRSIVNEVYRELTQQRSETCPNANLNKPTGPS